MCNLFEKLPFLMANKKKFLQDPSMIRNYLTLINNLGQIRSYNKKKTVFLPDLSH